MPLYVVSTVLIKEESSGGLCAMNCMKQYITPTKEDAQREQLKEISRNKKYDSFNMVNTHVYEVSIDVEELHKHYMSIL